MTTTETKMLDIRDAGAEILNDARIEAFFNKPIFVAFPFLIEAFKKAGILSQLELTQRIVAQRINKKRAYKICSSYLHLAKGQPKTYPFGNTTGQLIAKILGPEIMATIPAAEWGKTTRIVCPDFADEKLFSALPPLKAAFEKAGIERSSDLAYALHVLGLAETSAVKAAKAYLKMVGNPAKFPFSDATGKRVAAILGVPDTTVPTAGFEADITSFWKSDLFKAFLENQKLADKADKLANAAPITATTTKEPEHFDTPSTAVTTEELLQILLESEPSLPAQRQHPLVIPPSLRRQPRG